MQRAILKQSGLFYQFQNAPKNINAIFTNRELNLGFVNQPESLMKDNRQCVLSRLNLKLEQLVCLQQVHADNVYIAKKDDKGRGAVRYTEAISETDAVITNEKDIALSVFTADCLSVFIIDKKKNVIALVHAGWKSTKKSIVKKTIFIMHQVFETQPRDIAVFFGPAIRKCCYEVGEEFLNYFKRGITREKDKIYLDLAEINSWQLKESGVPENNIFDSGICTSCQNDKFFSYRREKESCGRQMSLVIMK
ncbi:MAG: peptidoglycan editing factor PgeF [Candidatus Omnitrophica bacterium]|nr:peptidoglycan editing factor PgeF [Candidatus Omnitrophota bacterium]MDD5352891.1 peptidoglycan editing factor PgeF [Candidatus Omnitrophota bacterium]MDD5550490.1 peptidoglycan editing factor PgeF [Candidatus Omnitrophota bacterium]